VTDLKALMELAAKVTPLPWDSDSSGVFCNNPDADGMGGEILEPHDPKTPPIGGIGRVGDPYPRGDNHPAENMRYIVAACNNLPKLCRLTEEYRRALDLAAFAMDAERFSEARMIIEEARQPEESE
jgi:hypothetical protein